MAVTQIYLLTDPTTDHYAILTLLKINRQLKQASKQPVFVSQNSAGASTDNDWQFILSIEEDIKLTCDPLSDNFWPALLCCFQLQTELVFTHAHHSVDC